MLNRWLLLVLCAAAGVSSAQAETFVIRGDAPGHDAMLKIPVGAITQLSADFAESLAGADAQVEAIHLKGDVSISIAGSVQPIHIKADNVVLELTPDTIQRRAPHSRSDAAANKVLRSTATLPGAGDSQVFMGNVVFDLQTTTGPMEIKADRVEHQLQPDEKPANAGA